MEQLTSKSRGELASDVFMAGTRVNTLRMETLAAGMPFVAGIVRGAEEALLVAHALLNDAQVDTKEL